MKVLYYDIYLLRFNGELLEKLDVFHSWDYDDLIAKFNEYVRRFGKYYGFAIIEVDKTTGNKRSYRLHIPDIISRPDLTHRETKPHPQQDSLDEWFDSIPEMKGGGL